MKNILATLIATVWYVGYIKKAPGTFGSLAAFPVMGVLFWFYHAAYEPWVLAYDLPYVPLMIAYWGGSIVGVFIKGWWASCVYMKQNGEHDPSEIVIDEVAGQMLVFLYAYGHMFREQMISWQPIALLGFISFVLFRLFDITKPFPISVVDAKCKGGFGVMIDDILAAMFALAVLFLVQPFVTGWLDAVS